MIWTAMALWAPGDFNVGDLADRQSFDSTPITVATAVEALSGWMAKPLDDWQDEGRFLCLLAHLAGWRTGLCLAQVDPGGFAAVASLEEWEGMGGTSADRIRLQEVFSAGVQRREDEMVML